MQEAFFSDTTRLHDAILADEKGTGPSLADLHWNGVNLAVAEWSQVTKLGDERMQKNWARTPWGKGGSYRKATLRVYRRRINDAIAKDASVGIRANRQLATALRDQGLTEDADRFAYRAQMLQRKVLYQQRLWLKYFGSLLLEITSGYGYKPMRSFITYLLVVGGFAGLYFLMRDSVHPALNPLDAAIFSITSFHGRGFNPGESVTLHNPLTIAAAVEAIIGLLIEITFIATFTQRFFAR